IAGWYDGNNGTTTTNGGTPISMRGVNLTGKNVTLTSGHTISGQITSNGTTGIANVWVSAYSRSSCCCIVGAPTAGCGNYSVVVPAGPHNLRNHPPHPSRRSSGLNAGWCDATSGTTTTNGGTLISMHGVNLTGKNVTLTSGHTISGQITSNGTTGIANV